VTPDEQLRQLVELGLSDPAIAERMRLSARTILRRRHRLGIGTQWAPPKPPHGTTTRYGKPHSCRCRACTDANTEAMRAWRDAQQRVTAPHARNGTEPWTAEDDAQLLASELSTAALARQLGRSYDATRKRRDRLRTAQ
jgi:hypothetical protein